MLGESRKNERSNSSASTTVYSLPLSTKLLLKFSAIPPKKALTEAPLSTIIWAKILDVVVLP